MADKFIAKKKEGEEMDNIGQVVPRPKLVYSIAEAAEILGIGETKMREIARTKGFPTIRMGKILRVSVKGLEEWIEKQAECGW